jgi:ABC-type glycerol-3-phosphate transport system permease component
MPIISTIEAKQPRGRLLHAAMFLFLGIGGVAMLYPFLIMVSGSVRTELDEQDLDLVPPYLVDRAALYRKLLENKYNEDVRNLNRAHRGKTFDFRMVAPPAVINRDEVDAFEQFVRQTRPPQHWRVGGGTFSNKNLPWRLREIQDRLATRFAGDVEPYNREMGAATLQWVFIRITPPDWISRRFDYQDNPLFDGYFAATDAAPLAEQQLVSPTGFFLETIVFPTYGQSTTANYNKAHARPLKSYAEFTLPQTVPGGDEPKLREEWVQFVRRDLHPSFVVLRNVPHSAYASFLTERYKTIDALNKAWGARHANFTSIPLPAGGWLRGMERQDYVDFLQLQPPDTYRIVGPEYAWREWLREKHGTIEAANAAMKTSHASFDTVPMPIEQQEFRYVTDHAGSLRWKLATSNYRFVASELFVQGDAFRNTMTLCALAVLAAIIVNPLAAYAMSRFRLRGTYNVLLILMATVAFPPMVTLIPKFIMLREMNLLNTFAALVLPFAANGYLIFLLKSFFDSLPQELYEAAAIDGASEPRIFFQITMSLSTPILAVVALEAFNAAYAMFLYALIVAPSPDMWLQTVWLGQFKERASLGPVFAAVLITCLPTLLVFILAQRVIMRGIIVPTEK